MRYIPRDISETANSLFKQYPILTITGPRQSGKTTLARYLFKDLNYYNLEDPTFRTYVKSDPKSFVETNSGGAVIDEIQRFPELLSYLQVAVDDIGQNGLFVITGSNQFALMNSLSQSLAGRTAILKLLPFSINELNHQGISKSTDEYIYNGFYPWIYSTGREPQNAYRNYVETYLERDVRNLINIKDLDKFQQFIRLCAGRVGQLWNASNLSNELGVSVPTIQSWISVLQASYIVFLLPPWYQNINKRLIKSPKLFFYDTGLASYLLGIENINQISRDPLRGNLFENLIISELLKHRYNQGKDHHLYFYRDHHGNEIDIFIQSGSQLLPAEIKSSKTFNKDFLKNLDYIKKLKIDRIEPDLLIYDGELETIIGTHQLINFRNVTEALFKLEI